MKKSNPTIGGMQFKVTKAFEIVWREHTDSKMDEATKNKDILYKDYIKYILFLTN